jgi:hypothetical protein
VEAAFRRFVAAFREHVMGAAYFIVLDQKDPGFDTMVNGKSLSKEAKRLERIAKSLGVRALDDYVSYSPEEARAIMEDLGSDPAENCENGAARAEMV